MTQPPTPQSPTIGRIVHYTLSVYDVAQIRLAHGNPPAGMNSPMPGDICPAVIVRSFGTVVNLQVFLDGPATYWATSRAEGTQSGTWSWPVRD